MLKGFTYALILGVTYMHGSAFEWSYCVLPDSLMPVKHKLKKRKENCWQMQKYTCLLTHTLLYYELFILVCVPSDRLMWWLTWLCVCCQLLCGPHAVYFFSSSIWWRRSSCHTETPGLAGSPGNPLEQRIKVGQQGFPCALCELPAFLLHSQIIVSQRGIHSRETLPLTFPMVCLEFRAIIGSVATPMSIPFSEKEEDRRQAVPTYPGWASPWTTCSLISSCKHIWHIWDWYNSLFHVYLLVKKTTFIAYQEMGSLVYQRPYLHKYYLKELKGEL